MSKEVPSSNVQNLGFYNVVDFSSLGRKLHAI